jgi:hypothetical protein
MRMARVCARGSRVWCARNGFSWQEFVSNGLPVSTMRQLNDPIINRIIAEAERERDHGLR